MDATTTRASTVIRSIPTSETRTHASMTMPLSRTRSRTSMRLVPPAARSTAMLFAPAHEWYGVLLAPPRLCGGQRLYPALEFRDLFTKCFVVGDRAPLSTRRKLAVVAPPVEADLLRLVE